LAGKGGPVANSHIYRTDGRITTVSCCIDVRQTEMHTAELSILEPGLLRQKLLLKM
jgi:hypothetical protein